MIKPTRKFIWLFGENLGETMDNNSWYSFIEAVKSTDYSDIDSYFILTNTKSHLDSVNKLDREIRERIVWRGCALHNKLYKSADMFFVSLSYRDVLPDKYGTTNKHPKPTIYLQHGITAIKKLGYKPDEYRNSLTRFVCYSDREAELLQDRNGFASYQTYVACAMPRWKRLVADHDDFVKKDQSKRKILWFITWREYLTSRRDLEDDFMRNVAAVVNNKVLRTFLDETNTELLICFHQLFDIQVALSMISSSALSKNENVKLVYQKDIDVTQELIGSSLVITDYSSIGFDATVIDVPVINYQFDRTRYLQKRSLYIDIYNDMEPVCSTSSELIDAVVDEAKWSVNTFYSERLGCFEKPLVVDGTYTRLMLNDFADMVRNKVTFIGYNFYGRGGTVSATLAMAEGLMERGYLVDLLSLKKTKSRNVPPAGLVIRNLYYGGKSLQSRLKRLIKNNRYLGSLSYDINKKYLIPYIGCALKKYIDTTNSRTVISTRETIHPFLAESKNTSIRNKIFYFHTAPEVIENYYPGLMSYIIDSKMKIDNAAFVTEESRKSYIDIFGFGQYDKFAVTGNSLQSNSVVKVEDVSKPIYTKFSQEGEDDVRGILNGVTLIRMAEDRKSDIERIIEFGKYLKSTRADDIVLYVYGGGDYAEKFIDSVDACGIGKYIRYCGVTSKPGVVIGRSMFVVDFAESHSFGMTYIESVLNGKMCFATDNEGSRDVLNGIRGSIYYSWEDLCNKIRKVPSITTRQLKKNYRIIDKKYGRSAVACRLESMLDQRIGKDKLWM